MQRAMAAAAAGGTSRTLFLLSLSSTTLKHCHYPLLKFPKRPTRVLQGFNFRPLCATATPSSVTTAATATEPTQDVKHSILLEKLRQRHLKDSIPAPEPKARALPRKTPADGAIGSKEGDGFSKRKGKKTVAGSFEELGLSEEVMGALREMEIQVPTEIQCIGIPAILDGNTVVLGSHTGSGKTLAYMLPLVQLLRRDEAQLGMLMKPKRPRAVVLCPTRELSEQVFRVAKSISHHARFRSIMVSGGGRLRPQEDSLNNPIDMVVGTPGRVLQHIADGNMVYGDIKYVVLDEADTMFDRGFGPEIRKFLGPLKNRASKPDGQGFQTILVTATMTKAVQKLIDEEFQGIVHLRTSSLHKKIASARHDFIKLSGSENKLEALLQVLEPSLAKGNRVMVFCNTLNSSRAVDHFLAENQVSTVNYHGEVPAEQRVENLKKFKSDDGDCPTLVCTDLAARGLDLDVDHVIMFDFPLNSIDYLHRTGRTARMGAKGKVTSLVAKKNVLLADRIEEAIRKNESLESLTIDNVQRDVARDRITEEKGRNAKLAKASHKKNTSKTKTDKSPGVHNKAASLRTKTSKASPPAKSAKVKVAKIVKSSSTSNSKRVSPGVKKQQGKLKVVAFRGRSSSDKKESFRPS
ncbi:DEAD-box ATP-dependent RNA helicase 39 [Turnera subulata]|uniref:DEAD-box ATP-dependent RNA helicase 39 n=1 Tax=Turnera subulata TaxID=218843 RepID=A0A9Q0GEB4_9ROSI|nr:DEAD-box ATP-dependent RNA helicase 39 [Turnera subulata]